MQSQAQLPEDGFTLAKYLSFVGLEGFKPEATLETLEKLIERHLLTFHYQNSALFKAGQQPIPADRIIPSLKINELFETMTRLRGGYCMQHLELFYAVLSAVGFTVDRHTAKAILQPSLKIIEEDRPKTHELLIVHVKQKKYVVDVGMGDLALRKPLEFLEGVQDVYDEQYRLSKAGATWTLDAKRTKDDKWFCFYRFFETPVNENELKSAHETLYLSPCFLRIRDQLFFAAQTTLDKRKSVTWVSDKGVGIFTSEKRDSDKEKQKEFTNLADVYACAAKKFGFKQ